MSVFGARCSGLMAGRRLAVDRGVDHSVLLVATRVPIGLGGVPTLKRLPAGITLGNFNHH